MRLTATAKKGQVGKDTAAAMKKRQAAVNLSFSFRTPSIADSESIKRSIAELTDAWPLHDRELGKISCGQVTHGRGPVIL